MHLSRLGGSNAGKDTCAEISASQPVRGKTWRGRAQFVSAAEALLSSSSSSSDGRGRSQLVSAAEALRSSTSDENSGVLLPPCGYSLHRGPVSVIRSTRTTTARSAGKPGVPWAELVDASSSMSSSSRDIHPSMRTTRAADPCMLCGCILADWMQRRFKPLQSLASFIEEMCVPTPFVYQAIVEAARVERLKLKNSQQEEDEEDEDGCALKPAQGCAGESVPCCVPCISWIHRKEKELGRLKGTVTPGAAVPEEASEESDSCASMYSCGQRLQSSKAARGPMPECDSSSTGSDQDDDHGGDNDRACGNDDDDDDDDEEAIGTGEDDDDDDEEDEDGNKGGDNASACDEEEEDEEAMGTGEDEESEDTGSRISSSSTAARRGLAIIPTDHVILFLSHPGGRCMGFGVPDRRILCRAMSSLNAAPVSAQHNVPVRNPYLRFCSPLVKRILLMFDRSYCNVVRGHHDSSGGYDAESSVLLHPPVRVRSRKCGSKKKTAAAQCVNNNNDPTAVASDESATLISDVVKHWWLGVGAPVMVGDSETARLLREALAVLL